MPTLFLSFTSHLCSIQWIITPSMLSRRSARCLLAQLSFVTDGFRYFRVFRSRRFVRPARCNFLGFVFSPHDCPFAVLLLVALVFAALDFSLFLEFSVLTVRLRPFHSWLIHFGLFRLTFRFLCFARLRGISVGPFLNSAFFSRRSKRNNTSP